MHAAIARTVYTVSICRVLYHNRWQRPPARNLKSPLAHQTALWYNLPRFVFGGIAQLVERLNGIEKVRGSTPLTSTSSESASSLVNQRVWCVSCFLKHFPIGLGFGWRIEQSRERSRERRLDIVFETLYQLSYIPNFFSQG